MPRRTHSYFRPGPSASIFQAVSDGPSRVWILPCVLVVTLFLPGNAHAQSNDDPLRFGVWLAQDVRDFPGAIVRRPSVFFGGSMLALAGMSAWDDPLARDLHTWHRRELWRVVEEFGDANAMRPAVILIFAGSLLQDDHRVQDAAFTGIEALILANVLTNALKLVHGRSRPWQEPGANDWEPFSGNTSFPSGHATTAFALMTPWVIYFDHPLAWTAIGLASATSLSRVTLRYHWPTDILAGAAIGASVSVWLSRRHRSRRSPMLAQQRGAEDGAGGGPRVRLTPVLAPGHTGLRLTF